MTLHSSWQDSTVVATQALMAGAGALAYLFGSQFEEMVLWIIALMAVDHLTAITGVLLDGDENLELRKFLAGLAKKLAMLAAFIPAGAIDRLLVFMDLLEPSKNPSVALVIIGLFVHESGSVLRNIIGVAGRLRFLLALLERVEAVDQEPKP